MRLFLFWLFFAAGAQLAAQSIQAMVVPERDSLLVGDPLPVKLVIQAPKGVSVKVPSVEALFLEQSRNNPEGDFLELLEAQDLQTRQTSDFNVFEQLFLITAWNQADYTFPALTFIAETNGRQDSFASAPVRIRSRFPAPPAGDTSFVADIKPLMEEPAFWSDYLPYLWLGLGAIGLLLTLVLLWRWLKNRSARVAPEPEPEELALEGLAAIPAQNEVLDTHTKLSFLLRRYLQQRYGLKTLENPTPAIAELLASAGSPLAAHSEAIIEVLLTADLVKFARASPLDAARSFAESTIREVVKLYQPPLPDKK